MDDNGGTSVGQSSSGAKASLGGGHSKRLSRSAISWAVFQGGRDCYVWLVLVYVFMPYLVSVLAPDPVSGQILVSRWNTMGSLVIVFIAPLLGSVADSLGRRKPAIAVLVAAMVTMMSALWWARPDGSGLGLYAVLSIVAATTVLFSCLEVLFNSLLVSAAGEADAHRASGLASSLGSAFSVILLAACLWGFLLPGTVAGDWLPARPLLPLAPGEHQLERFIGPLTAAVLLVGALPFFAFTRDEVSRGNRLTGAVREGVRNLGRLLRSIPEYRPAAIFLAVRMIFVDGMTALLLYLGIYAAGVMRWDAKEMMFFGVVVCAISAFGGLVSSSLDARIGPRRALQVEVGFTLLGLIAFLGIAPDRIFYLWHIAPVETQGLFATLPDRVFLAISCGCALFINAHYASSRTLLVRLVPRSQLGSFFGLYALSGTATLWLGSLLVSLGTVFFQSQQGGFIAIAGLLASGWIGLLFVPDKS